MTEASRNRVIAFVLFGVWLAAVCYGAWNHAVWRDEVRAFTRAVDVPNIAVMWKSLRVEIHPALWYLLLRGAYWLVPKPQVLQVVALLVAAASVLLLLLYAPFHWEIKALLLAGNIFLFEYSVVARNYGITLLLVFLLAIFYKKQHRNRGILLGILLFLLANCNAPSVILVCGFLLLWLVEILNGEPASRLPALRTFGWNTAIALLGIAICGWTIRPPSRSPGSDPSAQRSVVAEKPVNSLASKLPYTRLPQAGIADFLKAILLPGAVFQEVALPVSQSPVESEDSPSPLSAVLLSLLLFGSTLGLLRYPGIFLAALTTLASFSVFFTFLYRGSYRHEALWLSFLMGCYWIAKGQGTAPELRMPAAWQPIVGRVSTVGWGFFLLLMAFQIPIGVSNIMAATSDGPPYSCSRDVAVLIHNTPDLHDAIIMAEPDSLLEPIPYYVSNPTYLSRQQRYGSLVEGSGVRSKLTLDDLLGNARSLHAATGKPILILMAHPLDPSASTRIFDDLRHWTFEVTPEQERAFRNATQLMASCPAAMTDEKFDIYRLN